MPDSTWNLRCVSSPLVAHYFTLTPSRTGATLASLTTTERLDLFEAVAWAVSTHHLDGYAVAIAEDGPLIVHVVAGARDGTVQFDLRTGELVAKGGA